MKQATFAVILAIASIGSAVASPMSDAAQIHFSAIGAGDTSVIMRGYADNAQLTWVGGPLDGMYAGSDAIRATWEKFGKAVGPARVTVLALEESANPKGATIVAKVQFEGKAQVNVRYVLTYRDGKLVNETWQIDPKLTAAAYRLIDRYSSDIHAQFARPAAGLHSPSAPLCAGIGRRSGRRRRPGAGHGRARMGETGVMGGW